LKKEKKAQALERGLENRPDRDELIERNVMKEATVAPNLQAAKDRLEKEQIANNLKEGLKKRKRKEELVEAGVMRSGTAEVGVQEKQRELQNRQARDALEERLSKRPDQQELLNAGILETGAEVQVVDIPLSNDNNNNPTAISLDENKHDGHDNVKSNSTSSSTNG